MVEKLRQFVRHVELMREDVPDWSEYPFSIPAIASLERLEFAPAVTFFVGENGSGKSTLIEALAIKAGFAGEGGSKSFGISMRPSESVLHERLRLARGAVRERDGFFMRAETMFNVQTAAEGYSARGMEDLHEMSHGEAFLAIVMQRFVPRGLYILDEPEAALSPQRQLALLGRIRQLVQQGSQFIISTHSPILMAYPGALIYSLSQSGIESVPYEQTEHYTVTRAFLQNPERMIRQIFAGLGEEE